LTVAASSGAKIGPGIIDKYPFTRECIYNSLKLLAKNVTVLTSSSIEDCMTASANDFDLVLFHIHGGDVGQQRSDQIIASRKPTFRTFFLRKA
jgi:hypothetical protein